MKAVVPSPAFRRAPLAHARRGFDHAAIDAGAEDVKAEDGIVEIYTKPQELEKVKNALESQKIAMESVEISMQPKTMVQLDEKAALQAMKLLERLEEVEEVHSVASNADFDPSVIEKYQLQQA